MKKTAVAPSNIAFVKYWGRKNEELRLPSNGSISMNLSNLQTTTTVEFSSLLKQDEIWINGKQNASEGERVVRHLDRIRSAAGILNRAKVVSVNNFPSSTGLSSSSSGFAALTVAASSAAGLHLSQKELSILARQGSGSACRSIPDGFAEWLNGDTNDSSYAVSIAPADHWDIVDLVAVISNEKKEVATSQGQKRVDSSPFFRTRLMHMDEKIDRCKMFIKKKDFTGLGELIEEEALELHAIMLTSRPALMYWLPATVSLMKNIMKWRREGLSVYFTVNTGQDVHVICRTKEASLVMKKLQQISDVKRVILNNPAQGTRLIGEDLF